MNLQQPPQLRLDFYSTNTLMSQWQADGRLVTYPVSIHDVVTACTSVEMSSGLLPPNTLFWRQQANQTMLGIYVPARRWRVQTDERSYHIPLPSFVFVGHGTSYKIVAVKKRPQNGNHRLYHAPCPNVHSGGNICPGNAPFPSCSPETIGTALQLFLEGSAFNADLSGNKCKSHASDVRQLWGELDGKKRFPLKELVSTQRTLQNLL
ncbi:MAG: hypothetical protein GY805_14100 [Chloroflexi bacterium]|nr:hypothetical protein [Chloroflexota bacterium]